MAYKLNYQNQTLNLDKYCLKNSSMAGEKIVVLLDTEEELAYYAFKHNFYRTGFLSTVCSYNDLYCPEGKSINNNELNNIIKKHLPNETKKIDERKDLCNNKFVNMLMNLNGWKLLKYWIDLHKELIEKMPEDKKQKFVDIENKNTQYVNEVEDIINKKEQEKIIAEKTLAEKQDNNYNKFRKI